MMLFKKEYQDYLINLQKDEPILSYVQWLEQKVILQARENQELEIVIEDLKDNWLSYD